MRKEDELIQQITAAFPDLKLNFKHIETFLTIKPDGYLGAENFAKLKTKMNELGGEYVSAGKLSHFRIVLDIKEQSLEEWYAEQKQKDQPVPLTLTLNLNLQVTDAAQLEKILQLLKKHIKDAHKRGNVGKDS